MFFQQIIKILANKTMFLAKKKMFLTKKKIDNTKVKDKSQLKNEEKK